MAVLACAILNLQPALHQVQSLNDMPLQSPPPPLCPSLPQGVGGGGGRHLANEQ